MTFTISRKQNLIYFMLVTSVFVSSIISYSIVRKEWLLFNQAEDEYEKKNYDKAISLYKESLGEGLDEQKMNLNLANSYVAKGRFEEAIAIYKAYLQHHPDDKKARLSLAETLSWVGKYKEAEEEYKKIVD